MWLSGWDSGYGGIAQRTGDDKGDDKAASRLAQERRERNEAGQKCDVRDLLAVAMAR